MTRTILRRLRRTSADELRVRCIDYAWTASEALEYAAGARWQRAALRSQLLLDSPDLERAARALSNADWETADAALRDHFLSRTPLFFLNSVERLGLSARIRERFPRAVPSARRRADSIVGGRYELLGFEGLTFDGEDRALDWHFDPVHGQRAPLRFWSRVPYLDPKIGDHKIIWELNRHQHWLALGRGAWLTGDEHYAVAVIDQLEHWMKANPPLTGINWSSMLEVALRSISWMWAFHFCVSFERLGRDGWIADMLLGLDRQLTHVSRHLSFYFSPNTHLLGEALSLYVAGRVFPEFRSAAQWERVGRTVLLRESHRQVNLDGSHAELSPHYHRYALDFYLLALAIAQRTGDPAMGGFSEVALGLASFCRAICDEQGRLPTIGDDDGGLLFPICGREPADTRDSLALAAALLKREELALGEPPEEVFWMCGGDPAGRSSPTDRSSSDHASRLFPHCGLIVMTGATSRAILDAGPHGFLNAGHAHADALSVVLSVNGRPLLIDPGTATYRDAALRDRFRSTPMHNTAVVDGRSQSLPAGPFQWRSRANAMVDVWRPGWQIPSFDGATRSDRDAGIDGPQTPLDYAEAWHDGYLPLVHRRGVVRLPNDLWLLIDHIIGTGSHDVRLYWHVDPAWKLASASDKRAAFVHEDGCPAVIVSTAEQMKDFVADADGLGWCAPRYGSLIASPTICCHERGEAPVSLFTAITGSPDAVPLAVERAPVFSDQISGWYASAAIVRHGTARIVALVAVCTADTPTPRPVHRVVLDEGELATDARLCVLRVGSSGVPVALTFVDGTIATWSGPHPFTMSVQPAQDLHFDASALEQISFSLATA